MVVVVVIVVVVVVTDVVSWWTALRAYGISVALLVHSQNLVFTMGRDAYRYHVIIAKRVFGS